MVNANELRAAIARQGMTLAEVAGLLGISAKTFYAKMKKGVFLSSEMERLMGVLHIDNPIAVFFDGRVT